jgi:uncharacterized lipoprotein NlpE involved in copper resistance
MKKYSYRAVLIVCLTLIGCGNKQDANEKNFGVAISQYLDKKGELCLGTYKWPVDLDEKGSQVWDGKGEWKRMAALQKTGLVAGAEVEVEQMGWNNKPTGRKVKLTRYQVSEAGKKYYHEKEVSQRSLDGAKKTLQGDLCYGKKSLDKVVKWEGPMKLGDYQEAGVKYLYKIDGLADWARSPDIQTAFPKITAELNGVRLTSIGWEAKGLDGGF